MNIGFVGLGKLGLPCALAIDSVKKHKVRGFDIDKNVEKYLKEKTIPYREEGASELLQSHEIEFDTVENVIKKSDIIFLPIQTPHDKMYEGITRIPDSRVDFDYSYLIDGVKEVSKILDKNSVHFEELGIIIEKDMIINEKTKVTIDELRSYNTNWLTNFMSS